MEPLALLPSGAVNTGKHALPGHSRRGLPCRRAGTNLTPKHSARRLRGENESTHAQPRIAGASRGMPARASPASATATVESSVADVLAAREHHAGDVTSVVAAVCQVETASTYTVGAATQVGQALQLLRTALSELPAVSEARHFGSGVLRLEVDLPRGVDALAWLRSLPVEFTATQPLVYFAPRAPPPQPGGSSAGVSLDAPPGAGPGDTRRGAVAGIGAARLWRGSPGSPFDAAAAARVRRFVSTGAPRTRALGGVRFDVESISVGSEWRPFGSYLFMLPVLELTEAPTACTLACTLAWDDGRAAAVPTRVETGARSLDEAIAHAHAALNALASSSAMEMSSMADTTRLAAPDAPRPLIASVSHTPSEEQWTATVEGVLLSLSQSAEAVPGPVPGPAAMEALARLAASNGGEVAQQVLAAAQRDDGAISSPKTRAWDALADLARTPSGRAALQELAGRGGGETQAEEWWERARNGGDVAALESSRPYAREQAADVDPVPIEVLTGGASAQELLDDGVGDGDDVTHSVGQNGGLLPLTKVVLARRSDLTLSADVDALALLAALHDRSPGAYAFALKPPGNGSSTFVCCTPERLFALEAGRIVTEAVAGTRPRGSDERRDAALSYDLLTCPKEHAEFTIVQEWVRSALRAVCSPSSVHLEAEKQVLRTDRLQHLYSRLAGTLAPGATEADVLVAMHPTPAVCGAPRPLAQAAITETETFDRGLYAGPVGWLGSGEAEFAVAIRSALAHPHTVGEGIDNSTSSRATRHVSLYAGVGVVRGASPAAEWQELNYKVSQYESLLALPSPPADAPNINAVWAQLLVEECVRCGVRLFCIAPGSRSTPLALAATRHPRVRHVVCIDERSLAFHALGASKAGCLAAVITSSGTAVANLLPAVVEAAEAEVPILLLTADRPPELRGCGANQTIDQIGIYGSFTRWATEVGPPDAEGPPGAARQLLTTIDNAVFRATSAPQGPVHLNCAFREPLAPVVAPWNRHVLAGLDLWWSSASGSPLTTYPTQPLVDPQSVAFTPLLQMLAGARRGIIVAGHLPDGEDAFAVSHLAQTLGWPLICDVTSGLRVGATPNASLLPHFDLALMERDAWHALAPDVVLQFGGRLTSKRLQAFLEHCALERGAAWAFVARHPWRQDPGHAVRLRLQAAPSAVAAAACLRIPSSWPDGSTLRAEQAQYLSTLAALDGSLRRAVDEHLSDLECLTEMAVARQLSRALPPGHALFLGNSMPVRDMDVYADVAPMSGCNSRGGVTQQSRVITPAPGIPIACNRGASGIDGVVSSAVGFAAGLGRPTTLLIGDVSFAHDSNGLLLLRDRAGQPPVTVVVINNGGGAIFNFLPVAAALDASEFGALFTTPPDVRLADLCRAHRVHHLQARTPRGLAAALADAWRLGRHAVVEVVLREEDQVAKNLVQHRAAEGVARETTRRVLHAMATASAAVGDVHRAAGLRVIEADVGRYALDLAKPLTTAAGSSATREGALLRIRLACGATGVGDVAPLPGLHAESASQAVAQAATIAAVLTQAGAEICPSIALLDGSLAHWLCTYVGIQPEALLPSVRFALESAVLAALAQAKGTSLIDMLLCGSASQQAVTINALLPSDTGMSADAIRQAVPHTDCTCVKIKVARPDSTPAQDAARVAALRAAFGPDVVLRADANRGWTLDQAVEFGTALNAAGVSLEYLEEPTQRPEDIATFCAATGIAVALDETVDDGPSSIAAIGARRAVTPGAGLPAGTTALVLKPGVLGGLEKTACLVRWAHRRGITTVISSAFESSVGLAALAAMAAASNCITGRHGNAHGLGTVSWFRQDVGDMSLHTHNSLHVDPEHVHRLVTQDTELRPLTRCSGPVVVARTVEVATQCHGKFSMQIIQAFPSIGPTSNGSLSAAPEAVFLHGFMGSSADWVPVMKGLVAATGKTFIAVDLPGHGGSTAASGADQSLPGVAAAVTQLLRVLVQPGAGGQRHAPVLVGYSMGARVALHMALRNRDDTAAIDRLVCISGTAGVRGADARDARAARDDTLAAALRSGGVHAFSSAWYKQRMFAPLARKPGFAAIEELRCADRKAEPLSQSLAAMSPGRAPDLWPDLQGFAVAAGRGGATPALRVHFVVGALDSKFVAAARKMAATAGPGVAPSVVEVPACGHAVHMEAPETLVTTILAAL